MKSAYHIIFTLLILCLHARGYSIDSVNSKTEKIEDTKMSNNRSSFNLENNSINNSCKQKLKSNVNDLTSLGQLRLSLYESSALANNESAADGVLILFDTNGNNDIDANDAPDIPNLDENFSTNNNGVLLSIESRAAPIDQEEIQLEVNTYRSINYTIVAEGISMQNAIAFLYDNYTGVSTEIPQSGTINYSYSIDSGITQSVAGDRFKIIFDVETLSNNISTLDEVSLYPNPTDLGKFFVNIPSDINDLGITIYNVLGTKIYSSNGFAEGETITIVTSNILSVGAYFVEFISQGKTIVKKLIVI